MFKPGIDDPEERIEIACCCGRLLTTVASRHQALDCFVHEHRHHRSTCPHDGYEQCPGRGLHYHLDSTGRLTMVDHPPRRRTRDH